MSSSKKKTEHIERIRYPNPLPLPPYPPKLLSIPTPSTRYADPRTFGVRLATAHPLPVVVDSEAGMPLNMTDFPQLWYTDQEIEADPNLFPRLESADDVDEEDAFLLSDLLGKLPTTVKSANRGVAPGRGETVEKGQVTWLRRTEYLGAEKKRRERELIASRYNAEKIDASKEAQLKRIKESFIMANQPLSSLRHPTKAGLRAVEEHQVLPDPDTWASRFDVFRFGDPPGRTIDNKATSDPRLQVALLRPHKDLLERDILSLFLVNAPDMQEEQHERDADDAEEEINDEDVRPKKTRKYFRTREEEILAENQATFRLLESRKAGSGIDGEAFDIAEVESFEINYHEDEERVHFGYSRDYEPHDEISRKDQEIVLTFIDQQQEGSKSGTSQGELPPIVQFERKYRRKHQRSQDGMANGTSSTSKGRNVAYYHPVDTRISLRVRRRKATDPRLPDHWDAVSLGKRSFSVYEKIQRLHERQVVDDIDAASLPERLELPVEFVEEGLTVEDKPIDTVVDDEYAATEGDVDRIRQDDTGATEKELREEVEEVEEENGEGDTASQSGSESGSGDATGSEEGMDDDELAALQAEAGIENEVVKGGEERRSRRSARSPNGIAKETTAGTQVDEVMDEEE